jgi:hypothetical protein
VRAPVFQVNRLFIAWIDFHQADPRKSFTKAWASLAFWLKRNLGVFSAIS